MSQTNENSAPASQPEWLRVVQQKVESLRYGVVQLIVHDGRVTQIERTEKTRLPDPGGARETPAH
jgi:hypothetical protein